MSDLLDLQDDLSAVLAWLSETWSADLPVPMIWGPGCRRSRPIDLTVECQNSDELARECMRRERRSASPGLRGLAERAGILS